MDIFIIDILASHKQGSIRDRKSATATCNFENNPKVAAAQGPPTQNILCQRFTQFYWEEMYILKCENYMKNK